MNSKILRVLILLTYKGKALLLYRSENPLDQGQREWSFIEGIKGVEESFEQALFRKVEGEASIKIKGIEFISRHFYHARLTDDNVNSIVRGEGQLLNFFTLAELQKLSLSPSSREFVSNYGNLIGNTL